MRKALDELAALFHDGEVGAEIGVKYIIKAQLPEGGAGNARRGLPG